MNKSLLFFLFIFSLRVNASFTPHEARFYKTQVNFIKNNWNKIIENESIEILDTKSLVSSASSLDKEIEQISICQSSDECIYGLKSLSSTLDQIENECFKLLTKLGALTLSTIEKSTHRYTIFIKRLTDINHNISENKFLINEILNKQSELRSTNYDLKANIKDLTVVSERLSFQIVTIPQIFLNNKVQDLLILGDNEFIKYLNENINNVSIDKFHELDIVFNVMNRDLQKRQELISSQSKSILLQVHQRWNAILKIIKRK